MDFLQNDERAELVAFLVLISGNTIVISAVCTFESKLKVFEVTQLFEQTRGVSSQPSWFLVGNPQGDT